MKAENKFKIIVACFVLFFGAVISSAFLYMSKNKTATKETVVKVSNPIQKNQEEKPKTAEPISAASAVEVGKTSLHDYNLNANLVASSSAPTIHSAADSTTMNNNAQNNVSTYYDRPYDLLAITSSVSTNNVSTNNNMASNLPGQNTAIAANQANIDQKQVKNYQQYSLNNTINPNPSSNNYNYGNENSNINANFDANNSIAYTDTQNLNIRIAKLEKELNALKKEHKVKFLNANKNTDTDIKQKENKAAVKESADKILAVVGDRAWLQDKSGREYTKILADSASYKNAQKDIQNEKDVIIRSSAN